MRVLSYSLAAAVAFALAAAAAYGSDYKYWPAVQAALSGTGAGQSCLSDGHSSPESCLAEKYAPQYRFHPLESHYPSTVDWYLSRVKLRFSQGNGCPDGDDVAGAGAVTSRRLPNYVREVRERDWHGLDCDGTNQTMPSDRAYGSRHGFFLQAPNGQEAEVYSGMKPRGGQPAGWEAYAHVVARADRTSGRPIGWEIQYWLFFPRDDGPVDLFGADIRRVSGGHEGDWETVIVHVDTKARPQRIYYKAHGGAAKYGLHDVIWVDEAGGRRPAAARFETGSWSQDDEFTHPVVYVGLSKHASHPSAGVFPAAGGTNDHTADGGIIWNAKNSVRIIKERWERQEAGLEWISYGGHWGEVGAAGASELLDTTGPTGPAFKGDYCSARERDLGEVAIGCLPPCAPDVSIDDAWVILYQDRSLKGPREYHWARDPNDRTRFRDYNSLYFHDKVSSAAWCLPTGAVYEIYSDRNFSGKRLALSGSSTSQSHPSFENVGGVNFNDVASSSRFVVNGSPMIEQR